MKPVGARLCLAALLAVSLAIICAATAATADAAPAPGLGIDPPYGPPLTIVKLTGTGFCPPPCTPLQITIASVRVDTANLSWHAGRSFTAFAQVPGSARPGDVPVVATQTDTGGQPVSARTRFALTINIPPPTRYPTPPSLQPPGGLSGSPVGSSQPPPAPAPSTPAPTASSTPRSTPGATTHASASPRGPTTRSPGASSQATAPSHVQSRSTSSSTAPVAAWTSAGIAALIAAAGAIWWWYRRRRTP